MKITIPMLRVIVKAIPDVITRLSDDTRFRLIEYKSYNQFDSTIERLVHSVYYNNMGAYFITAMQDIISSQLTDAYQKAWADSGFFSGLPSFLSDPLEQMIKQQFSRIDGFYNDIIKARENGTPIEPLLSRAKLWSNQFKNAYNEAIRLIALYAVEEMVEDPEDEDSIILAGVIIAGSAAKLQWHYGDTEHCTTCQKLNGIVAFAVEWAASGVHPQDPPNGNLECGGWRCGCSLSPTSERRTKNALSKIQEIVG